MSWPDAYGSLRAGQHAAAVMSLIQSAAADGGNTLAMLVRRDAETLPALLKRLDKAIAAAYDRRG